MGDCTQRCRGPPPAPLMLLCQLAVVSSESLCFHAVKWGIILLLPCNVFVHVEVVLLLWILGMELIRKGVCVSGCHPERPEGCVGSLGTELQEV